MRHAPRMPAARFAALPAARPALLIAALALLPGLASVAAARDEPVPPKQVEFHGSPKSPISSAVTLPAGRALFFTSGTVPPAVDTLKNEGDPARYGDTRTQAAGVLNNIEKQLAEHGLSLKDVIYLRVYVVADPLKENRPDFNGWFQAYGARFGTAANPTKPARSTVAVAGLVNPGWLIEIEIGRASCRERV